METPFTEPAKHNSCVRVEGNVCQGYMGTVLDRNIWTDTIKRDVLPPEFA